MVTPPSTPTLQLRLVGPAPLVDQLTHTLIAALDHQLGAGTTYKRSTHPARRAGHIRCYITATPQGEPRDDQHDH